MQLKLRECSSVSSVMVIKSRYDDDLSHSAEVEKESGEAALLLRIRRRRYSVMIDSFRFQVKTRPDSARILSCPLDKVFTLPFLFTLFLDLHELSKLQNWTKKDK